MAVKMERESLSLSLSVSVYLSLSLSKQDCIPNIACGSLVLFGKALAQNRFNSPLHF